MRATGVVGQIPKQVRNDIKGNTVIARSERSERRGNPVKHAAYSNGLPRP